MKLYGFNTPNMTKVLLTAEILGLDYEYIKLNPGKAEHKTPEHLQRHPLGKIPVLEHDGRHFIESNSICRYLACVGDSGLYSGDAAGKAVIDQWVDLIAQHIGRWIGMFYFQEVIKTKFFGEQADAAAIEEARNYLNEQLPVMEQQLSSTSYLAGDDITIADIIAFSIFHTHEVTSLSLDDYPNIKRWYQEIKANPAYERVVAHYPDKQILN